MCLENVIIVELIKNNFDIQTCINIHVLLMFYVHKW